MKKLRSKEIAFASPVMPDAKKATNDLFGEYINYREDVVEEICERIASGEALARILGDNGHPKTNPNLPDMRTVTRWLAKYEDFRQRYRAAREIQAETLLDEITRIADDSSKDTIMRPDGKGGEVAAVNREFVERSRLRVQARQWLIAKMHPKKYGEKVDVTHSGAVGSFDLTKIATNDLEHLERILIEAAPSEGDKE